MNGASVDIVDGEGSFEFSAKHKFTPPLYFHITLSTETEAESLQFGHSYRVKNMLKFLANDSPSNFNLTGRTVSADIIVVTLFCFSSVSSKMYHLPFLFCLLI